jgi:hypothetical protein
MNSNRGMLLLLPGARAGSLAQLLCTLGVPDVCLSNSEWLAEVRVEGWAVMSRGRRDAAQV